MKVRGCSSSLEDPTQDPCLEKDNQHNHNSETTLETYFSSSSYSFAGGAGGGGRGGGEDDHGEMKIEYGGPYHQTQHPPVPPHLPRRRPVRNGDAGGRPTGTIKTMKDRFYYTDLLERARYADHQAGKKQTSSTTSSLSLRTDTEGGHQDDGEDDELGSSERSDDASLCLGESDGTTQLLAPMSDAPPQTPLRQHSGSGTSSAQWLGERGVTFADTHQKKKIRRIRKIDSHRQYTAVEKAACWYSKADKQKMIEKAERMANKLEAYLKNERDVMSSPSSVTSHSATNNCRGLESWTEEGGIKLGQAISLCLEAVLHEQEGGEAGYSHPDRMVARIAKASMAVTKASAERAHSMALDDEAEAIRVRSQPWTSDPSNSPPTSRPPFVPPFQGRCDSHVDPSTIPTNIITTGSTNLVAADPPGRRAANMMVRNERRSRTDGVKSRKATATVATSTSTTTNNKGIRSVSFGHVSIRFYARALSDNPSVQSGPAIGIGWEYYTPSPTQQPFAVDEFEEHRVGLGPRTKMVSSELVLSRQEREKILTDAGYRQKDIADMVRTILKTKNQRKQTINNLEAGYEGVDLAIESATGKVGRLFRLDSLLKK